VSGRISFVASSRTGLGHLRRVLHVARALRRLRSDVALELVTNAPPPPSWSLDDAFEQIRIRERADVSAALADDPPDVVVVDTAVVPGLDQVTSRRVLLLREVPETRVATFVESASWDAILIPCPPDAFAPSIPARIPHHHLGWVQGEARTSVPDPASTPLLTISTGGGGNADTAEAFATVARPLLRGLRDAVDGLEVIELRGPRAIGGLDEALVDRIIDDVADPTGLLVASDLALTTAGYNTVLELAAIDVPAILIPIPRAHDDQAARVTAWAPRLGASGLDPAPALLRWAVDVLAHRTRRAPVDLGQDGAREAAAHLAAWLSGLAPHPSPGTATTHATRLTRTEEIRSRGVPVPFLEREGDGLLTGWLSGLPVRTRIAAGAPLTEAALRHWLEPVSRLHGSEPPSDLAPHDPFRRIRPRLDRADAPSAARELSRRLECHPARPRGDVFLHGDLHVGQLIDDGNRTWLLDVDDVGRGPAAHDLGNLVAHLVTAGLPGLSPDHAPPLIAEVASAYAATGCAPRPDSAGLRWSVAVGLLRRGLKLDEAGRVERARLALAVAASITAALPRGERRPRGISNAPDPSVARVTRFLDAVDAHPAATGHALVRVDLDRRDRLSAVLRDAERPIAALEEPDGVRLLRVEEDRALLRGRALSELLADLPLRPDPAPVCVAWRPGKRAVFAVRLDDDAGTPAWLKIRRRALDPPLPERLEGVADLFAPLLVVPDVPGPALELWGSAGDGSLRDELARGEGVGRWIDAAGRFVAELAARPVAPSWPRRPARRALDDAAHQSSRTRRMFGHDPAPRIDDRLPSIRELEEAPIVPCHGDLHDAQIHHRGPAHLRLLDPDTLSGGPLELDAANLAAHLELHDLGEAAPARLAAGVRGALPTPLRHAWSPVRFETLRALTLARLASVYRARPAERARARGFGQRAAAALERLDHPLFSGAILALLLVASFTSDAAANGDVPHSRLRSGLWAEVEGEAQPGDRVEADEVEVKVPDPGRSPKVRAPVQAILADGARIRVLDVAFEVVEGVRVIDAAGNPAPFDGITPGTWVELRLRAVPGGWEITEIELREPDDEVEIEGFLSDVEHRGEVKFRVNGVRAELEDDGELEVRDAARPLLIPPLGLLASDRARSDDDWQPPGTPVPGIPHVTTGGRISARLQSEEALDLSREVDDEQVASNLHARAYLSYAPSPWFNAYGEIRWTGRRALRDELDGRDIDESRFQSGETWFLLRAPTMEWAATQVGRIEIEEDREWFFDENLDGVRLIALTDVARVETGAYRTDVTPDDRTKDDVYYITRASWRGSRTVAPELVHVYARDRRADDERRHWIGGRLPLRLGAIETWSDWLWLRGDYRERDAHAWAADNGLMLRFRSPIRWAVYGGYAFGSGDPDRSDDRDREFRDTDLADNTDAFDGLKSFNYYGELTDLELSNVRVWTAGVGARPLPWISVDLVLHGYRQDHLRDKFRSDIEDVLGDEYGPFGEDKDLGREVNVVVGMRSARWPVDVEISWARFSPGYAYAENGPDEPERMRAEPATRMKIEVEWRR